MRGRQPDPRRAARRRRRRTRPLPGRRLRGDRARRRARAARCSSTAKPTTRSRATTPRPRRSRPKPNRPLRRRRAGPLQRPHRPERSPHDGRRRPHGLSLRLGHALHELGRVLPRRCRSPRSPAPSATEAAQSSRSSQQLERLERHAAPPQPRSGAVTSATPPGSVPTVTLTGCATSQTVVADMLQRLRLIDGVKEATLHELVEPLRRLRRWRLHHRPSPNPTFTVNVELRTAARDIPSERDQRLQPGHVPRAPRPRRTGARNDRS